MNFDLPAHAAGTTEGLSAEHSESSFIFLFLLSDEELNNTSVGFFIRSLIPVLKHQVKK